MITNDITRYQNWARKGYVDPLRCLDKYHPPLIADIDAEYIVVRCVFCEYRREIGLAEQRDLMAKIKQSEAAYVIRTMNEYDKNSVVAKKST